MADHIAVLGAGAWGTALAGVVARPGRRIVLWARDADHAAAIEAERENRARLPGVRLAPEVRATADPGELRDADIVLAAVPAQSLRAVLATIPAQRPGVPIVVCAKGIERETGALMSEVVEELRPRQPAAALSGPSFAVDVGRGRPTAITVAARDETLARALAGRLGAPAFRLYFTDDLAGVEIGGAAKNVLAIGCGIAAGLDLGASAMAALVARGFAELARFGRVRGARAETLMGLAGLGDLVLTCSSPLSRNFSFGRAIGEGADPGEAASRGLAEGAATAAILATLAARHGIDMPIVEAVASILDGRLAPGAAIETLLARPLRAETE